jgi:transposase
MTYMAIKRHKRGDRVYLAEYKSIRVGKKVISKFVRYIGPEDKQNVIDKPQKKVLDRLELNHSYRSGDVKLLWSIANDLGFSELIDTMCCSKSSFEGPSPGKLLTAWAINRALDPESATRLERWMPTTELPNLLCLPENSYTKDAFLNALDFICARDDDIDSILDLAHDLDKALHERWRKNNPLPDGERETIAYDMTTLLFFGVNCSLAELGYNPDKIRRLQVNLALLVSSRDKYPIMHFVYEGSRHSASTVKNLLARLSNSTIEPGTLIWDRGNISGKHVELVEKSRWKLISGVPKTLKAAKEIIAEMEIHIGPESLVRSSQAGHIYAEKTVRQLYGKQRSAFVYENRSRGVKDSDARNEALLIIGQDLDALSLDGKNWSEKKLHAKIESIVSTWSDYFDVIVSRKLDEPRVRWSYKKNELRDAEKKDGKWLLVSTDDSIGAHKAVNAYLEKDFIEKVFRVIKTQEEVQPVRHRLENRVRAYLFVCMLAYRLLAVLQWRLKQVSGREDSWESAGELLQDLSRVEKVDVRFGNEIKTLYLNLSEKTSKSLKSIGMGELFKEETRLDVKTEL